MTSASPIAAADKMGMDVAFENARKSYDEGGVPIGAALVYHGGPGEKPRVVGQGHNQRIQKSSPILHGEMAALENAGRLKSDVYRNLTMVSIRLHVILARASRADVGCAQYTTLRHVTP